MSRDTPPLSNSGRRRRQFSLLALLVGVGIVGMVLAGWRIHHQWQGKHRHRVLLERLHKSVRNGDSIEKVQSLLGPGDLVQDASSPIRTVEAHPDHYPHGVEPGDIFLLYDPRIRDWVYLQFRNGRLVNHRPEAFAKYSDVPAQTHPDVQLTP
jgi:hypothetical protein